MSTDKMTIRDQLEESPYKAGLIGIGFNNPLTSEGICQVLGRDPGIWSARIVYAINNTYGASINPEAVKEMFQALAHVIYVETGVCTQGERRTAFERAKAAIEKATIK